MLQESLLIIAVLTYILLNRSVCDQQFRYVLLVFIINWSLISCWTNLQLPEEYLWKLFGTYYQQRCWLISFPEFLCILSIHDQALLQLNFYSFFFFLKFKFVLFRIGRMVLGYAYPAFQCFKTVEKNKVEIEELRFWCQYW